MSINKDKLIRLMYERPVLWNHKHADYRNASLKQHAWIELASEFQMKGKRLLSVELLCSYRIRRRRSLPIFNLTSLFKIAFTFPGE